MNRITITVVEGNFAKVKAACGEVRVDQNFVYLQHVATTLGFALIANISVQGYTIINERQLSFLQEELEKLKLGGQVNQKIMHQFQQAVDKARALRGYIKFTGAEEKRWFGSWLLKAK